MLHHLQQMHTRSCFCTWSFCRTDLDFTALPGFWLEGRVAAVAPGYQLLPLVTLHFANLDATPTGLTALRGHEGKEQFDLTDAQIHKHSVQLKLDVQYKIY